MSTTLVSTLSSYRRALTLVIAGKGRDSGENFRLYMTNADVIGTWSSSWESFKMAVPGAVRGTITRDSGAGIAGPIGVMPDEVPVTSTATDLDTGKTATSTSYGTAWIIDNYAYSGIAADMAYPALYRASGDSWFEGTVRYTLTLQVNDGTNAYTITRRNTWDDDWDASSWAIEDMWSIYDRLLADHSGLAPAYITSVSVDSTLTRAHERATIADVRVPGGLVVGENTAHVTLWDYGVPEPREVDVSFTIPAGMSTRGDLVVSAGASDVYFWDDYYWDFYDTGGLPPARQSLAEVVADIDQLPSNEDLQLAFWPNGSDDGEEPGESSDEVDAAQATGTFLSGYVEKTTSRQSLYGARIKCGARARVHGILSDCSAPTTVKVYKQTVGSASRVYVGEANVTLSDGPRSPWRFTAPLGRLTRTTKVITVWDGDDGYLGSTGHTSVRVAARVGLRTRAVAGGVRLIASVVPRQSGHPLVLFQGERGGRFVTIGRRGLDRDSTASMTWRPGHGAWRVRVLFLGSPTNTASRSLIRTVTVP